MADAPLPALRPGYARCVRCRHIFLLEQMEFTFTQLWCSWCVDRRPGNPHGKDAAAACVCRLLAC